MSSGTTESKDIATEDKTPASFIQNEKDILITTGSLWKAIWVLSWPVLINMCSIAVASCIEVWVAGKLGYNAQAAIGLGGQIWFLMIILTIALSAGSSALVSRFWGAKDTQQAIEAARQSIVFSIFFAFGSATTGLLICRPLLHFLGASAEVEELGWQFLRFDLLGQIPITILWVINPIFRARGDMVTPMLTAVLTMVLVVILDLGLTLYPFHLGVSGLGIGWGLASCISLAVSLTILRKSELGECLNLRQWWKSGLKWEWFMRLMKIGIPACIQDLAWVGGNMFMLKILSLTANPTASEAAWSIGMRLEEMVAGLPIFALATAIPTIIGQNLGAGKAARASQAGWQIAAIAVCYGLIMASIFFLFAEPIATSMTKDKDVIGYSVSYLKIVGLAEPFVALWLVLSGALQGAGYTKRPMLVAMLALIVIRLPLAWWLTVPCQLGPVGTWISISASAILIGLSMVYLFAQGRWQLQKI